MFRSSHYFDEYDREFFVSTNPASRDFCWVIWSEVVIFRCDFIITIIIIMLVFQAS